MAEKQTNKDRMREIVDSIENGIKELFESDKYRKYLATMSRFHRYSVNNTMLIYMQRPDATHVAGFNKWRDQFGRNVLKGEKGIRIIAPTPYKKKVEEIKTDPETNAPILDADGKAVIEEKEIRIPMFKVVSVFDVSQTAGKPLPQLAADLSGNVQQYEVFMEALRRALHALDTAHLGEKARADACRALREHEMAALREAADELGLKGGRVPHVDAATALPRYRAVNALMGQKAIAACHDCSDGGLAVALAEMCIGGRLGAEVDLNAVPALEAMNLTELLYSESASRLVISVRPDLGMIFDALGQWQLCTRIGTVTEDARLTLRSGDSLLCAAPVEDLAKAFKRTLDW